MDQNSIVSTSNDPSSVDPTSRTSPRDISIPANTQATSLTKIPRPSTLPRKGILKRSGSARTPNKRDHSLPPDRLQSATSVGDITSLGDGLRRSPRRSSSSVVHDDGPRSTPSTASKIPKLCVTWWETNSICGEAPRSTRSAGKQFSPPPLTEEHDRHSGDDENDDTESIQSNVSSLAGNWWFGRTTRYVPHCERRHLHETAGQYLTPTQRKNREIGELKCELRRNQKMVDEKDRHLAQLRDRLSELERIMDQGGYLAENERLRTRMNEMERERCLVSDQYEERLKRLKSAYERESVERETTFQFELDELRSTLDRDQLKSNIPNLDDHDSGMSSSGYGFGSVASVDACTMTDTQLDSVQELQAYQYECMILRNRVSELEFTQKQYEKDLTNDEFCGNKSCATKLRAQFAQLEAYKNECFVWRTKAAEMEIALKHEFTTRHGLQMQIEQLQQSLKQAAQERQLQSRFRSSSSLSSLTKFGLDDIQTTLSSSKDDLTMKDSENGELDDEHESYKKEFIQMRDKARLLEKQLDATKKQLKSTIGHLKGPCAKEKCLNERKRLNVENDELKMENASLIETNESLTRQSAEMKRSATEREEMLKTSEQVIQNLDQQLNAKRTELDVNQLSLHKLRDENEKLRTEVQDLNGKLANLETILSDCGIVVSSSVSTSVGSIRRKSIRSGQATAQLVCRAREVQTDLTWQEETKMELELKDLIERYAVLQVKYDEEKGDLEMKLDEISQNLHIKNGLVGKLTNQIQILQAEYEAARAGFERERLQYSHKLHDLDLIAQRVPFLEHDVATTREEMQMAENNYENEKGRFEKAMEDSLVETMKSHQNTAEYWRTKLESTVKHADVQKRKCEQAQRELSDTKMRLNLEKVELERKLQSAFNELADTRSKLDVNRENREVQTVADMVDKAIFCCPKTDNKWTEILKCELSDERDVQLKMLQGELHATRRQVEILQGKLLISETVYQQLEETEGQKKDVEEKMVDLKEELENMKADMRVEKESFESRYRTVVNEKEQMALAEQEHIRELETAFELVRQELDSIIKRYELEKLDLQKKIEQKAHEFERVYDEKIRLDDEAMDLRKSLDEHVKSCTDLQATLVDKNAEIISLEERLKTLREELENEQKRKISNKVMDLNELERQIEEISCICDDETRRKLPENADDVKQCPVHGLKTSPEINEQETKRNLNEVEKHGVSEDRETSPATEESILDMKAKLLFLMRENQDLRIELNELKTSVASLLQRHDSLKRHQSKDGQESQRLEKHDQSDVTNVSSQEKLVSTTQNQTAEESITIDQNSDLDSIRDDLQHIANRFELLPNENHGDRINEEAVLMEWLKEEMRRDKSELDVLMKWYDADKRKLENEMADMKNRLRMTEEKADVTKTELEQVLVDFHDVSRELQLYKSEDARTAKMKNDDKRRNLRTYRSLGELSITGTKYYQTTLAGHYFKLEKKLKKMTKDRDELQQELNILRVDHALVEIDGDERATYKRQISESQLSKDTTQSDELDELKHQLNQAERCAARLESEATQWMNEMASMKGKGNTKRTMVIESGDDGHKWIEKLIQKRVEQTTAKFELELMQYKRQCDELRKQLTYFDPHLGPVQAPKGTAYIDSSRSASHDPTPNGTCDKPDEKLNSQQMQYEETIRNQAKTLEETEEKLIKAEKELKMIHEELRLKSISYADDMAKLKSENDQLSARLRDKAADDCQFDTDTRNYAKMEAAIETARGLQEKVDKLMLESEEREKQHQEMYLLMFRKGQEAAKLDMAVATDVDGAESTSSSDWSFEGHGSTKNVKSKNLQLAPDIDRHLKNELSSKCGKEAMSQDEIALQFLRDAVYYFLVDRDAKDHLQAIMSILKFSERQRSDVLKAKGYGYMLNQLKK